MNGNYDSSIIPKRLKRNFYFLKYPFFLINTIKRDEIIIKRDKNDGCLISWKVSRNIGHNLPSKFARRVHLLTEKKINEFGRPAPNIIKLGSLNSICEDLNITKSGKNKSIIKGALKDIQTTTIETKNCYRIKGKDGIKKCFEGTFQLYDSVFFTGETLPDGSKADSVYVLLNQFFIENFNHNHTVPLDYDYYLTLNNALTSRLYEILSLVFYTMLERKKQYVQLSYNWLCEFMPLINQLKIWKAKKQMGNAHKILMSDNFLQTNPEFSLQLNDEIFIKYTVGKMAEDWYKKINYPYLPGQNFLETEDPLLEKMTNLGVELKIAKRIYAHYDKNLIEIWLDKIKKSDNGINDKAAFFVSALKNNWQIPKKKKKKDIGFNNPKEKALKNEYFIYIKQKIEDTLTKEEIKLMKDKYKKTFFDKYPNYSEYKDFQSVDALIETQFHYDTALSQNFMNFQEWKKTHLTKSESV